MIYIDRQTEQEMMKKWDETAKPYKHYCDYVFASRCLNSLDPAVVLPKLTRYAKKRVCITIHVNHHDGILSGFKYRGSDSLEYEKACFNTVIDMGYYPRVDYMDCMFDEIKGGWTFISWDV